MFVHWDDPRFVYDDPAVVPPSWQNVEFVWTHLHDNIYSPLFPTLCNFLAFISEKLGPVANIGLNGTPLNAAPFHIANILLHAGSAAALCAILIRLTKNKMASALGALFFAVHPLNVETVAWIAPLNHDICMLLGLVALYLYIVHAQKSSSEDGPRKSRLIYFTALIFGVLAMFAISTAVILPATAFAIDLVLIKRPWKLAAIESGPLACDDNSIRTVYPRVVHG